MLDKASKIIKMAFEREPFYKLKKEADDIMGNSKDVMAFLDALQVVYRNILMDKTKGISLYKNADLMNNIHLIESTRKQIKSGVAPAYAIKNLLLKIGG